MRHSLYLKFILAYLVFGLLGFLVVATFSSRMTLRYLTEQRAESLYREANYISANFVRSYYSDSPDAPSLATVYSHFQALDTYLNASIWLLNADGTLLVNSEGSYSEESNTVIEEFDPTDMGSSYYMISDFYGLFREETLTVAAPITYNFRPRGYVLIHLPMSILNAERDGLLNATYLTLILIFTLSLMILVAFTFTVYRPLKKITEAARQYAQGNFKYQPEIYGEDEIGQLAATLNYMAHELDETDEYQKKFVANISHDFRSPLTSIKGYVEAMLDGTIPPEMQEKYLNIVLMETERLNKLTSGLLTLNSFDTKKNRLDITDFDINTVIKNTVSSFEGQCRDRHISIELLFDAKEQFVSADMGKNPAGPVQPSGQRHQVQPQRFPDHHRDDPAAREGLHLRQGSGRRHPQGQHEKNLGTLLQDRRLPGKGQKGDRPGTLYRKRNHHLPRGAYQRHLHRGRRDRVYLYPAPCA